MSRCFDDTLHCSFGGAMQLTTEALKNAGFRVTTDNRCKGDV